MLDFGDFFGLNLKAGVATPSNTSDVDAEGVRGAIGDVEEAELIAGADGGGRSKRAAALAALLVLNTCMLCSSLFRYATVLAA